ncbi:Uncharacterised protein [Mycobacteroides abscessus subsp. abscessus]|uniref:hypothetical protein n=1 Tax=Mycobacteroides abscessus TaxID=36809 RepID=UPI0009268911|nr:hypothetical protein [Mycobacteroides abscessus]SIL73749.1 Uncharacterised protein [Mycobacteroides abscessus subsp. abscessus]
MSLIGENLIRTVRRIAAANPDFVYEAQPDPVFPGGRLCRYVHNGEPSCLIGKALWELGLINSVFETNAKNVSAFGQIYKGLGLALDHWELDWLIEVQRAQDFQTAWGRAVESADVKVRDRKARIDG